jgi:hypothetical protein
VRWPRDSLLNAAFPPNAELAFESGQIWIARFNGSTFHGSHEQCLAWLRSQELAKPARGSCEFCPAHGGGCIVCGEK